MPQDGLGENRWCRCENCWPYWENQRPEALIWGYTVELAERLQAEQVPGFLTQMAYGPFNTPPPFDIPDNVLVQLAASGPWKEDNPQVQSNDTALVHAWNEKLAPRKIWLWNYVNNQACDDSFWKVSSSRLNGSFNEIAATAKGAGVELSLWFAPSTNRDYTDWRRMADLIWGFYRDYCIQSFKLDGVMLRTKRTQDNLERLVDNLCRRSNGAIVFNFDTTNGQRSGYWLFVEYGNLFLENRYVHRSDGLGYHPESVLRNFWRLTRFVRAQKLQIEIADPGLINRAFYREHNLCQPDVYPATYWAAIALFANPLVWLNPSALSKHVAEAYRRVFEVYRAHRQAIFTGEIYPVGSEPDGASITGFQSWDAEAKSGYLIVFREREAPPRAAIPLKFVSGCAVSMEELWDSRLPEVSVDVNGVCRLMLEASASFRLLRYRTEALNFGCDVAKGNHTQGMASEALRCSSLVLGSKSVPRNFS